MWRSEETMADYDHLRALSISMVTRVDRARDCGIALAVVKISHGLVAKYSSPGATGSSIPSPYSKERGHWVTSQALVDGDPM